VESIGFQREPAILRVAGSLWNLAYPLQIPLWKKQRPQQGVKSTLNPDEPEKSCWSVDLNIGL
jgi:hypothetical protein